VCVYRKFTAESHKTKYPIKAELLINSLFVCPIEIVDLFYRLIISIHIDLIVHRTQLFANIY